MKMMKLSCISSNLLLLTASSSSWRWWLEERTTAIATATAFVVVEKNPVFVRQKHQVNQERRSRPLFRQLDDDINGIGGGDDDIDTFDYDYGDEFQYSSSSSSPPSSSPSWSVTDDWDSLSKSTGSGTGSGGGIGSLGTLETVQVAAALDKEAAAAAAARRRQSGDHGEDDKVDRWIQDVVDEIQLGDLHADLYDTATMQKADEDKVAKMTEVDMGEEIAMLIRCNESPQKMLIEEGRALPPLTDEEKYDVSQLVDFTSSSCKATNFLQRAVSTMFQKHAKPHPVDGVMAMTASEVAAWMTCALSKTDEIRQYGKVSPHDSRVLKTLSDYSSYGSGRLVEDDLQDLYLSTLVGDYRSSQQQDMPPERYMELFRQNYVDAVWRDIIAHGILPPIEEKRIVQEAEINVRSPQAVNSNNVNGVNGVNGGNAAHSMNVTPIETVMDECEILDWDYRASEAEAISSGGSNDIESNGQSSINKMVMSSSSSTSKRQSTRGASSYKVVELAEDNTTPLWMRDGDFVFIDEESCIGCYNCANIAPAAFKIMDSGRARTFHQRKGADIDQAIHACPVDCMHSVSFRELQEFETARDEGDGRTDHKHLGHQRGHTPLHVAGMASDNNHRSSWYHTLKHKCLMSSDCPQKGCYDCPKYSQRGENPFFKANHVQAEHIRAQHFLDHGDADHLRNFADL